MSTCSTATSTLRGHEIRRRRAPPASCDAADVEAVIHGLLERRLVDLERDWDAYKTGRSSAAPRHRHRRSRSATGTPSSAVTTVAAPDALLLPLYRCSSPRALVSSLQWQTGSANSGRAAKIVLGAGSPAGSYEEGGLSSVCSVEAGHSAAAPSSSCSCPCRCPVCSCCYSNSCSSCAGATAPSFSSAGGADVPLRRRTMMGGRWQAQAGLHGSPPLLSSSWGS